MQKCWGGLDLNTLYLGGAWLAQLVENVTLDLRVICSSPTVGMESTLKKKEKTLCLATA